MDIVGPIIVVFVCLAVMMLSGHLIAFALAVTGLILIFTFAGGTAMAAMAVDKIYHTFDSYVFMAVPMYIFMGELILRSRLGDDLYTGMAAWLGRLPGGLVQTNVASCAMFAAISGSSAATAATIGTVAYPQQTQRGYDSQLVLGSLSGSGTLGLLIPPSLSLLIYGGLVGESIGKLFMGGMIPGIMMAIIFMLYIGIRCSLQRHLVPRKKEEAVSWKTKLMSFRLVWPIVFLMMVILGGIYMGVTTPTEAAGVGGIVALAIVAGKRRLSWPMIRDSLLSTARTSAMLFFVIMGAMVLSFGLTCTGMPRQLASIVLAFDVSRLVIFMMICLMYLGLGCLMGAIEMMVMTLAIVYPLILALGFDSVWFGVVLTMLIEEAQITPPVGFNLFVLHGITKRPISEIVKGSIPYFLMLLVGVGLLYAFPQLVLWLPNTMITPMG